MGLEGFVRSLKFLEPERIEFHRDSFGKLNLKVLPDDYYENVKVLKLFPLSRQTAYLSVRDKDNNEIGLIKDLKALKSSARKMLAEELETSYFIPTITHIYNVKTEFGMVTWEVETDKGPRTIDIRGESSYSFLSGGRVFITDVHDNQFQIRNISKLDAHTQTLLDKYL